MRRYIAAVVFACLCLGVTAILVGSYLMRPHRQQCDGTLEAARLERCR